jgi:hypothetical protein
MSVSLGVCCVTSVHERPIALVRGTGMLDTREAVDAAFIARGVCVRVCPFVLLHCVCSKSSCCGL